jgi:hypothetical protein
MLHAVETDQLERDQDTAAAKSTTSTSTTVALVPHSNARSGRVLSAYNSYARKYVIKFNREGGHTPASLTATTAGASASASLSALATNSTGGGGETKTAAKHATNDAASVHSSTSTGTSNTTTSGSSRDRTLTSQALMANEFNQKIKLTNKKLEELNKKLNLYRMNQMKSASATSTANAAQQQSTTTTPTGNSSARATVGQPQQLYHKLKYDVDREESKSAMPQQRERRSYKEESRSLSFYEKMNRRPSSERDTSSGSGQTNYFMRKEAAVNTSNNDVLYEEIAEYDEPEDDEFFEEKADTNNEEFVEESHLVQASNINSTIDQTPRQSEPPPPPAQKELAPVDELERFESRLAKSQGLYNFVATSTSQLNRSSRRASNKVDPAKPNNDTNNNENNDDLDDDEAANANENNDDDFEDDGTDYVIYSSYADVSAFTSHLKEDDENNETVNKAVAAAINEHRATNEIEAFRQSEQNVTKVQRAVLAKLQRAVEAYKNDHTSVKLPINSANHLSFITSNYNSLYNTKGDLYKFYERSRNPTFCSNSLTARTKTNSQHQPPPSSSSSSAALNNTIS